MTCLGCFKEFSKVSRQSGRGQRGLRDDTRAILHGLDFEGFCKPYYGFKTFFPGELFSSVAQTQSGFWLRKNHSGHSVNNELEMTRLEAGRPVRRLL